MSFSLSARKLVLCWCSLVAIPLVTVAQGSFVSSGGEYLITGKLAGDQVLPQLSFTTNGGYIVWQDNWIDGHGLGVGAMRLKSDLSGTGLRFLVNSLTAGDQENARVSLLNNGGAAFVWQGGRLGFEHIYSRFLSPSNSWLTGDVMVNSDTNHFQENPVMATLLNGNVVIAYASRNQAAPGSMADVYLQMFSPAGSKVGGEVQVNQFTDNNQRSPSITALADGRFAVAWVSEQQRWTDASNGVPSVDIYARLFDGSGSAVGSEFPVNVSSNVCATPDITSAPDGGFMAAWMEKDLVVLDNGWDIYTRRFTSSAVGGNSSAVGGNENRINTQLYGDQFSPKVARAGTNYLAIWTSLGQDGSFEGVYGRYLNDDGSVSGNEFRVNTSVFGPQKQQVLASDGAGRFLAAWTGFGMGVTGYDLFGQQYVNPTVAAAGTNNSVFNTDPNANPYSVSNSPSDGSGGGGGGDGGGTTGVTNSFADVQGTYNGLVYDANAPANANSGYVSFRTTAKGSFSAKLEMGARKYSFSGMFDATGANTTKLGAMTINLLLDLHGGDRITGQVTVGNTTTPLQANLAVYGKGHSTSLAGSYTMVVQSSDGTIGTGVGTVKVNTSGNITCSLTLPDGAKVTEKTTLSKDGAWPLYAAPYKGSGGMTIGWIQFGSVATNGFDGQCLWMKPRGISAPYSGGLTNGIDVSGSLYSAPPLGFRAFGNSKIILSGGGLSAPITNSVTWGSNNKILAEKSSAPMKLKLSSATGLFKGMVTDPATGNHVSFQGVLFEKNNVGLGFFLGGNESGAVSFAPNP